MKRSALTPLLLAAGTLACTQEKPNVVLFVVDDMGPMDTSVPFLTDPNGAPVQYPLNHRYHTPNMERLSNQGIRFSQFYAQSVSSPSRCSLLTGQDAARHRTTNWIRSEFNNRDEYGPYDWNWQGLRRADYLLPRLMRDAGYRTIHVGKAHLGPIGSEAEWPDSLGFDINIAGSSIGEPGSYLGENGYGLLRGTRSRAVPGLEKYHGTNTFLTEALTLEALEAAGQAIDQEQPFFLYLSHYAVHNPFEVDRRFAGHYQADSLENREALGYATLVEGMDKSLGDLLEFLERKGVADKTLIIFLGDNDEGSLHRGLGQAFAEQAAKEASGGPRSHIPTGGNHYGHLSHTGAFYWNASAWESPGRRTGSVTYADRKTRPAKGRSVPVPFPARASRQLLHHLAQRSLETHLLLPSGPAGEPPMRAVQSGKGPL